MRDGGVAGSELLASRGATLFSTPQSARRKNSESKSKVIYILPLNESFWKIFHQI